MYEKKLVLISSGVTAKTGGAFKLKTTYLVVFFGHFLRIVVFVTIDAAEKFVITRLEVTISTIIPLSLVLARIDGKIGVMNCKTGWLPIRCQGMTKFTIIWKSRVVYALGGIDGSCMTADTIGIQPCKIADLVAGNAV